MYTVYHGSWRDFGTAVGAIVCTEMNTIFGATFVGHCMYNVCTLYVRAMKVSQYLTEVYRERWFAEVFCSLRSHGTRFAYGRLRAQALSQPCLVMRRAVMRSLYVTKLVTYRVCGTILNAVYRERAERTLVRLLCLKRHALNASRIRCVNDSRL